MTIEKAKEILYMQWQGFLENNIDYAGVSDAYKMAFKALEELQEYRKAWNKMQEEIDKINPDNNSYSVKNNACLIVNKYRPKEGKSNDNSNN